MKHRIVTAQLEQIVCNAVDRRMLFAFRKIEFATTKCRLPIRLRRAASPSAEANTRKLREKLLRP